MIYGTHVIHYLVFKQFALNFIFENGTHQFHERRLLEMEHNFEYEQFISSQMTSVNSTVCMLHN